MKRFILIPLAYLAATYLFGVVAAGFIQWNMPPWNIAEWDAGWRGILLVWSIAICLWGEFYRSVSGP